MALRFGLIGSGSMAVTYARAFRHMLSGAEAVAVFGGHGAPALAREFGLRQEPSLDALLGADDVDAVLIATPNQHHRDQTLAAAAAGLHVFVEKPIAPTLPEVDDMIAACRAARVKLGVNAVTRWRRGVRMAKQLVDDGVIGEIRMVRHTYGHLQGTFAPDGHWILDPSAGSPFLDVGSHCHDTICWFVGDEVRQVFAHASSHEAGREGLSAMATLIFERGAMCSIWASYEFPPPGLDPTKWTGDYLFVGSKGMLDVQYRGTLRLGMGDRWETLFVHPDVDGMAAAFDPNFVDAYAAQVQDFIDAIAADREPEVNGETARKAIEIAVAADRSAAIGQVVALPFDR